MITAYLFECDSSQTVCVCDHVQRETLLRQLETNQLDIDATLEELSVQQETEDQNYEMYCLSLPLSMCALQYSATRGTFYLFSILCALVSFLRSYAGKTLCFHHPAVEFYTDLSSFLRLLKHQLLFLILI